MIPAIEFKDVRYSYAPARTGLLARMFGGKDACRPEAIRGISLSIGRGEFVAIAGTNGAGKTTVSKLMNGLVKPDSGEVLVDGVSTRVLRTSELSSKVGMLFQNPDRQICRDSACDEVAFGLRLQGMAEEEARKRACAVLADFGIEPEASSFALSRGERQRLAFASAVALRPEVLILDEPTTGLDYRECMRTMASVRELNEAGVTVVMICHDMEVVADFASRVVVMADGRVVADGAPSDVFADEAALKLASLEAPQVVQLARALAKEAREGGLGPAGFEMAAELERAFDVETMAKAIEALKARSLRKVG